MKKIAFLSILAGLFMVGCTEMAQPADPQQNAQEELVTITGAVTATAVPTIDLAKVEGDSVKVVNVTAEITAPEGTELKYYLTLNETVEYEVPADTAIVLPVAELQAVVEEIHGKRPVERKISAVVTVAAVVRGSAVLYKSEKFDLVVIPSAPFISSAYYLIGGMNDWDSEKAKDFKFIHSGKDVYEDPVFTIAFTAGDECWWKIVPQSNYDAGDAWAKGSTGVVGVAVNGDEALEGKLSTSDDEIGAGVIKAGAGMYKMTINMMDYTYAIEKLPDSITEIYFIDGAIIGWDHSKAANIAMYPSSPTSWSYTGAFGASPEFKIFPGSALDLENNNHDWSKAYGAESSDPAAAGKLKVDGGNIKLATSDLCTFTIDLVTEEWTAVVLENQEQKTYKYVSLMGNFCGWDAAKELDLEQVTPHNWVKKGAVIAADGGIMFRADHDWGTKWCDGVNLDENAYGTLATGGADNTLSAGTYDVYFNDITGNYLFVKLEVSE